MNPARPPIPLQELDEVLVPWEAAWKDLRGARILLAGGTGTLGTWMLELFCRARDLWGLDARIQVLSRHPDAFRARSPHLAGHRGVSFLEGDVRTLAPLAGPVDLLVHGAADASGPEAYRDLLGYLDTLVAGTRNLLEKAVDAGARKVLILSSGAVYGPQPPDLDRIPEDLPGAPDPLNPGTRYAQGKRMAEHFGAVFQHERGLACSVARGFALAGPHLPLDAHFALGNFIRDALAGGPVRVLGDGTPFRSYLYASDYAMACWLILLKGRALRAYNVGSEEAIQIGDLARLVAREAGLDVVLQARAVPGTPPQRYVPSIHRLRSELGFVPSVGLEEGVRRMLRWYRM